MLSFQFLNKGSTVIFLVSFISTTYIITFSIYLCSNYFFFFQFVRWDFGYCGHYWPIVPAPDDRRAWLWRNWWNEDWRGKPPKYSDRLISSEHNMPYLSLLVCNVRFHRWQETPCFYRTWRFTTVFTKAYHWALFTDKFFIPYFSNTQFTILFPT
jgi:hypothetical protein